MRAKDKAEYVEKLTRKLAAPHAHASHTPGPWYWERTKIGTWQAMLLGQPNEWNDRLVTAMRLDLAAFPYAIDTPNAKLMAAAPELLEACKLASEIIKTARKYFPKSIRNSDSFQLEITCAAIGKAIAKAEGGAA